LSRGRQLLIVNPVREQDPFHHPDVDGDVEIALHWEGVGPRSGVTSAWVSLIQLHPGRSSTLHAHPGSEEFFVVTDGKGVARELHGEELVEHPLEKYDIVMAPRSVPKQIANTGHEPLMLVQVYAPAPPAASIQDIVENDELATHIPLSSGGRQRRKG
jgi:mannose-6-phosphate isomerase-like protein (cupin superfamily)